MKNGYSNSYVNNDLDSEFKRDFGDALNQRN